MRPTKSTRIILCSASILTGVFVFVTAPDGWVRMLGLTLAGCAGAVLGRSIHRDSFKD
jgi:hypothetical protein